MEKAKILWSERFQAVRLPKGFRFGATEVSIRKHGNSMILEPIAQNREWLDSFETAFDTDFLKRLRMHSRSNSVLN